MPLHETPLPTGLTLPQGPVTPDFRKSLETALDGMIPDGKSGALLVVVTEEKAIFGVAAKINGNWTVGGDIEKQWGGDLSGRVMVKGTW